jgi:hypothetical protein
VLAQAPFRPYCVNGGAGSCHECPKDYLYLIGAVDDRLRKSNNALHQRRESGTVCVVELLVRWRVRRVILEMRMLNPLFALSFEAARFGLEMQSVVALRLMRLMGGSEARRSVSEKMAAVTEAQTSATTVSINNDNDPKAGKTVSNVYKQRGRAKKRRLSK